MYIGLLLVICSAVMHASWNLFAKRSVHKETFLFALHAVASVIFLPFFVQDIMRIEFTGHQTALLLASFFFQGAYLYLLSKAYRYGEMSQVYPMMRGTAAMLVPILSVFIYQEQLSPVGWIGLALIVGGLFSLSGIFHIPSTSSAGESRKGLWRVVAIAMGVGLCTAGYTLTDKMTVQFMSPLGLIEIANLAAVLFLYPDMKRHQGWKQEWRINWSWILLGSIFSPGAYLLFLVAMQFAPLVIIAPIREFSIVLGTVFGIVILKEKQGRSRILTSFVVVTGMIAIGLWG